MDLKRSDVVFLSTLTNLRWLAIIGQSLALIIGATIIKLELNIIYCMVLILLSLIINVVSITYFPQSKRLSGKSTLSLLMYDLLQLSLLLYLCGGLTNPFSVLILAPVAIAATLLSIIPMALVGSSALIIVSMLSYSYIPLELPGNEYLLLPDTLMFGMWVALMITIIFISAYAWRVKRDMTRINELLLTTKLALEREQKLTALSGVVAAAAHELGSPLTTIKLVSSELLEELSGRSRGDPTLEDLELIKSQAERCKEILKDMATDVNKNAQISAVPIIALVKEACLPFQNIGKEIKFSLQNLDPLAEKHGEEQVVVRRSSELIHGLRNIIQNATDFSKTIVFIDISWSKAEIFIVIKDDGPGFPKDIINSIGEPFGYKQNIEFTFDSSRPEYEPMGLGLFIAKTLLERSGAKLTFKNYSNSVEGVLISGAEVISIWNRDLLEETWN